MVRELRHLGRRRYIGDSRTRVVHDRWHTDCQGCGLMDVVRGGHAVGFEPDTLDAALWADYEYCEACHDKTEPVPPRWARKGSADGESATRQSARSTSGSSTDAVHRIVDREVSAAEGERGEVEVTT